MRPGTIGMNGKNDVADSRTHGDSIEVEFQELLKIGKVDTTLDDTLVDSIEQEHDDEDSLFKSFTEDQQQKQTSMVNAKEHVTISPELPRISIHVANQSPRNKHKKAKKHVPDLITESLVTTVDVQKKSNDLPRSDVFKKSSGAKQHKPTNQQQNKGSRVLNILKDLDTTSIAASSRASGDSLARTSSDGSSSPYGLNTSSCSISTTSFPADPTPSTAHKHMKAMENKKNRRKRNAIAQKHIEYFAADEISIIDDGGCEAPSIPEILTAFSKSEFNFQKFTSGSRDGGGTGERELRILPDTARDRSLLSVDSSYVDNIDRTHSLSSSSSSSFGCSSRNDDRRNTIPKSISTPNLASTLIEKSEQDIQTTTIETSRAATASPVKKGNPSENEFVNNTSRSSRKRLQLWKLPMLSFASSPSIDSEDVSTTIGQQLREPANISVELSENDFNSLNRSLPVDLDDPVSDDTEEDDDVKVKNDTSTILEVSEHLSCHGIGETVLEDCGSAIEATISEQDIHTPNNDVDMTSSGVNDDNKTDDTRKEVQSSLLPSSNHSLQNKMKLLDTNVLNNNAESQSDASTYYCSFRGDDEVLTEDNDDQLSLDTTAWATKVHTELERIAEIVRLIDSKNKIKEDNEKVPLDNRRSNSPNDSDASNVNDKGDDDYDDNSKQHQMSTTSEIRESRQFTKYSKQSALLNEQRLLDLSQSHCSENESFEQYDYYGEATYNRNSNRPKLRRRLRVAFGGCLKSRAQSSLTSWNGTNSTYAGTTVRMGNKKSKIETVDSTGIPVVNGTALDHAANDDDCSSTQMMTQGLLLKTDGDHIRKYLVDSEHSGTSDKSCFRRPKWLV